MFHTEIKNKKIFDTLFEHAKDAETIQTSRHSAAIVHKRKILALGRNSRKTHPLQKQFAGSEKPCLHAETDAIIRCINLHGSDILKDSAIYCLRLTNSEKVAISKPCPSCRRLIDSLGIKRIYWT